MIYGVQNGEEYIKPVGGVTLDWGNSLTDGLVGYWPFTEAGGRRWRNAVNGKEPVFNGSYPGRWVATQAGLAMDVTQADSSGQTIIPDNVLGGFNRATIGLMIYMQVKSSVSSAGAIPVGTISGAYCTCSISSDGSIDNHCRFDFIANTAYARPNISQLTVGSIYTIFATWISGTNPSVYAALWPGGKITELTYSDRGAASGTIGTSTNIAMGLNGSSRAALRMSWLGMWNRPIRVDEMQSLHNFPWQMIADDDDWYFQAAGGWASRISQMASPGARVVS